LDLAVLGAARQDYEAYAAAVHREYSWVPEPLWVEGRRKVLERFELKYNGANGKFSIRFIRPT